MDMANSEWVRDERADDASANGAQSAISMLCYSSRPIPGLEQCRLRALVQRARESNAAAGITGCLVFDGRQIVQVLEGEQAAVEALFGRIQRDPRHECVRLLWQGGAHRREFAGQPMACYNLAWRRMCGAREAQEALNGLVAALDVDLTDIVSLARLFEVLRLPSWPGANLLDHSAGVLAPRSDSLPEALPLR